MRYQIDEVIEFKKNHACGSNRWIIVDKGALIKLKCTGCNRIISILPVEIDKRKKQNNMKTKK